MNLTTNTRQSYAYLRSVCRDFCDRMMLGDAIKNGWTAATLSKLAEDLMTLQPTSSRASAHRDAISIGMSRTYSDDVFSQLQTKGS